MKAPLRPKKPVLAGKRIKPTKKVPLTSKPRTPVGIKPTKKVPLTSKPRTPVGIKPNKKVPLTSKPRTPVGNRLKAASAGQKKGMSRPSMMRRRTR